MIPEFIRQLQIKCLENLPGLNAQMNMAPPVRTAQMKVPKNVRLGGVAVVLSEFNNDWQVLLMKRTSDGGTHSGQISFPGGTKDENDFSITYTALRELEEEMGIQHHCVKVLGGMSELFIPPSNFLVYPTLMYCPDLQGINPSKDEVSEVLQFPLQHLLHSNYKIETQVYRSDRPDLPMTTPAYQLESGHLVWGATAMMLAELEQVLLCL